MRTKKRALVAKLRNRVESLETTVNSLEESLTNMGRRATYAEYHRDELVRQVIRLTDAVSELERENASMAADYEDRIQSLHEMAL